MQCTDEVLGVHPQPASQQSNDRWQEEALTAHITKSLFTNRQPASSYITAIMTDSTSQIILKALTESVRERERKE
jgi:hypothetical protein